MVVISALIHKSMHVIKLTIRKIHQKKEVTKIHEIQQQPITIVTFHTGLESINTKYDRTTITPCAMCEILCP